ncbi:hypothetical protein CLOM_g17111, partial [Closterium sp. NIES-68]
LTGAVVEQLGISGVLVLESTPAALPPSRPAPHVARQLGRLLLGDIITAIDGKPVQSGSDLYKILDKCKSGQTVDVRVLRGTTRSVCRHIGRAQWVCAAG